MKPTYLLPLPLVALIISLTAIAATPASTSEGVPPCEVEITTPDMGDDVGHQILVKGVVRNRPANTYLWVLIGVEGLRGWWPQGGGAARVLGPQYSVRSFVGGSQDLNSRFSIAATIVDANTNVELERWVKEGAAREHYPPIPFPNVVEGCPIAEITVTKVRH